MSVAYGPLPSGDGGQVGDIRYVPNRNSFLVKTGKNEWTEIYSEDIERAQRNAKGGDGMVMSGRLTRVDREVQRALEHGLSRERVTEIVRTVYAAAVVDDRDEGQIADEISSRLSEEIRTHVQGLEYDEDEDVAVLLPQAFMDNIMPAGGYPSWNDACAMAIKSGGLSRLASRVEELREVGSSRVVTVTRKNGHDMCRDIEEVCAALLAGVQIVLRVELLPEKKLTTDNGWYEATGDVTDTTNQFARLLRTTVDTTAKLEAFGEAAYKAYSWNHSGRSE